MNTRKKDRLEVEATQTTTYFPDAPGKLVIVPWYANNETYLQEVRFSVPFSEWNRFLNSELYRELEKYVDSLKTQDKHTGSRAQEYIEEIGELHKNLIDREHHESF